MDLRFEAKKFICKLINRTKIHM